MNASTDSSIQIEERAGAWLARRESGDWSAEDQAQLTQWLEASTANRVAFLRQSAAWEYALRLQALKGNTPRGVVPSVERWRLDPFFSDGNAGDGTSQAVPPQPVPPQPMLEAPQPASRGVRLRLVGIAASLLLVATASLAWYLLPRGPTYSTPIGGIASVPIGDGSKITLNTDSQIRVAITEKERRIELRHGEAYFEVAHDSSRPFVVMAGEKRVVVVGTKFSVRRVGDDIKVFVTEGKVRIDDESESQQRPGSAVPQGSMQYVAAGDIARTGEAGIVVQQNAAPQIEDYLSWRTGYLVFHETPLATAIAEFNRYNEEKISVRDSQIAAIRFSGKIRPTSFEPFIRLLEETYPIHADRNGSRIVLTAATH